MGRPKGGRNRYYSTEFKQNIIKQVLKGKSARNVAKEHGIYPSNVFRWIHQYKENGFDGLKNKIRPGNPYVGLYRKKAGPSEVEKLRYELVKAEVEIVKLKKQLDIKRREESQKR